MSTFNQKNYADTFNPLTSDERLLEIAQANDDFVSHRAARALEIRERRAEAADATTTAERLAELSIEEDTSIVEEVAENPNTSAQTLRKLSAHSEFMVRAFVAWNDNTPSDVLAWLSGDAHDMVRAGVAQNPSTPEEALIRLLKDSRQDVVEYALNNPSMSSRGKQEYRRIRLLDFLDAEGISPEEGVELLQKQRTI